MSVLLLFRIISLQNNLLYIICNDLSVSVEFKQIWSSLDSGVLWCSQDLDLSLLLLVFSFIFTVASRFLHLYSTDDKTSRLKMKSFSTLRDTQRGSLFSETMVCFSGCLMSSASTQKLFCGVCSALKCSFEEFVREKVVFPSYYSTILGPPSVFLVLCWHNDILPKCSV